MTGGGAFYIIFKFVYTSLNRKKDKIIFILTGGTIDSRYDGMQDTPMIKNSSGIKNYLDKNIQPVFEYDYQIATFKDSRDITEEDRKKVVELIQSCPRNSKIIITHGTYTMPDTARFLKENISELDSKTIILTGSMIPLEGFSETDASFNIGFAIASAQLISRFWNLHCHEWEFI